MTRNSEFGFGETRLPESAFFEQLARSRVSARIPVTRVDHVLAMLAVVSGIAPALVLSLREWLAHAFVGTRVRVARVALGQDFFADRLCEIRTRQYYYYAFACIGRFKQFLHFFKSIR